MGVELLLPFVLLLGMSVCPIIEHLHFRKSPGQFAVYWKERTRVVVWRDHDAAGNYVHVRLDSYSED